MFVLGETRSPKTDDPDSQPAIHQSTRKVGADSTLKPDTLNRSLAFNEKVLAAAANVPLDTSPAQPQPA